MEQLKRRVFRERRRLAVFAALAALSGCLLFVNSPTMIYGLSLSVYAVLVFATLLPAIALVVILLIPSYRFALELTGIVMVLFSLTAALWPDFLIGAQSRPEFVVLGGFVAVQALAFLIYGKWSDNRLRRGLHVERAVVMSSHALREDVWSAFCPTPATQSTYWDKTVNRISKIPNEPQTYMIRYKFEDGKWMDQRVQFDQMKKGKAFRYNFQTLSDQRPGAEEPKVFTVNLENRPDGVTAHLRLERRDYPARKSLLNWIDDHLGRIYDKAIKEAELAEDGLLEPQY